MNFFQDQTVNKVLTDVGKLQCCPRRPAESQLTL